MINQLVASKSTSGHAAQEKSTYTSIHAFSFCGRLISMRATYSAGKETLKYWYSYLFGIVRVLTSIELMARKAIRQSLQKDGYVL